MEELQPIVIDLNCKNKDEVNERVMYKMASDFSILMRMLFGTAPSVPVSIRGTPSQVSSFGAALGKEKNIWMPI